MAITVEPTPLGLLFVLVAILTPYFLPWTLTGLKFAIPTIWVISKFSIVPQLLYVLMFQNSSYQDMETQVSSLLDLMRSNTVALPIIQGALRQLKGDIKHKHVPQVAVASIFDIIRLALVPTEYLDLGFSTLTHVTRRLIQQRQIPLLELQARRTIPLLFELFDHEKERIRGRAVQALAELCHISFAVFNHVETILRDEGLRSQSKRIIPAVCEWIIKMHQEKPLDFIHHYSYVSLLVECLRHNEPVVVVAAKKTIIQLYRDTDDHVKVELKSKLRQRHISEPIMEDIVGHIVSSKDITTTHHENPETQPTRPRAVNRAVIEVKALHHGPAEASEAPINAVTAQAIQLTEAAPVASSSSLSKPTTSSSTPSLLGKSVAPTTTTLLSNSSTTTATASLPTRSATTTAAASLPTRSAITTAAASLPTRSATTTAAASLPSKPATTTATASLPSKPATTTATTALPNKSSQVDVQPLPYLPKSSPAELGAAKLEPLYVESAKDVEATFAEMLPHFAGKETGENWLRREQSALKIRRLTCGNAPEDYLPQYTAAVKSMSDGLIKGCTSLRTTLCTEACHCVQDIARTLKQGLDPVVEVYFQCFLKLCASTKKITSAHGNACMAELVSHVTFSTRISQHLLSATQDKNVQPRLYASEWLMIVLTRYGRQRAPLDQNLDNLTSAISNGLKDRDPGVREAMRPTFWAYARLWNDKSRNLISQLDKERKELVLSDTTNPFPKDWFAAPISATPATAKSTSNSKPSIKDTIAQQRRQKNAALSRPGSAAETATPARDVSARIPARPNTSMLTTRRPVLASSTGSMSSAPVRPNRFARKPDTKAEAKVDMKADGLPTGRIAGTPATKPFQTLETRTTAKISAKATLAPVSTIGSVSEVSDSGTFSMIDPATLASYPHITKSHQTFETRAPTIIPARATPAPVSTIGSVSEVSDSGTFSMIDPATLASYPHITKPHQTFETRTPTIIPARVAPTPVAAVESVPDSEALAITESAAFTPDTTHITQPHQTLETPAPAKIPAKVRRMPVPPDFESVSGSEPLGPFSECSVFTSDSIQYLTESLASTEPEAVAPDTHKRVSWSEDDLPVEFSSCNPPNEVSLALIGKTPTDPVDTITRIPVNGKTTAPVGEATTSLTKDKTDSSDRHMFRCPSDGTLVPLPVEPSELLASETSHLSVDGTFNIPAPEVAALATAKMPRRSSLKSSNQPNITKEHRVSSQATSNTARDTTETTALTSIEADSQTPEFGTASRLSQSPRPLASRKEGLKGDRDSRRLKVYEDEEQMSEDILLQLGLERGSPPPSPTLGPKGVLGELPVNRDITKRRNSYSAKMTTDQNVNIHQARHFIGRIVPRIQDGTIDHEGFKQLHALTKKDDLWATGEEGQPVFDDLVQSLGFVILGGSPYDDMDHEKLRMLRVQAISMLNTLYRRHRVALGKWSQYILRSVAVSHRDYPSSTAGLPFISLMMLRLAENMLELADQERNLHTLFKLLESDTPLEQNILALQLLTIALDKGHGSVDKDTEWRLGRLTCLSLGNYDTDVRIAATKLATKMFLFIKPESRFWQLLVDLSEEQKNLVAYCISKTEEPLS